MKASIPIEDRNLPRRSDLPWRQLAEDRAMLLNLDSGDYYELRGAAPFIWKHLDGKSPLGEIAQILASIYAIDVQRALRDLSDFVQKLDKNGLLSDSAQVLDKDDLSTPEDSVPRNLPYEAPSVCSKGNLKYLGQLD